MKLLKSLGYYLQTNRPLGWAQLSHQKVRLAVAMTGVAFSNILIFTEILHQHQKHQKTRFIEAETL